MWKHVENLAKKISQTTTIFGAVLFVISYLLKDETLTSKTLIAKFLILIISNYKLIWYLTITSGLIFLSLQYFIIHKHLKLVFIDKFKKPINHNWDFIGDWTISKNNELTITNSFEGGLSKKGSSWENYTFTFKSKIIKDCVGFIVRAKDINNYYMFQISSTHINPHRKFSNITTTKSEDGKIIFNNVEVAWQVMNDLSVEHKQKLDNWFDVRVEVDGQTITIFINEIQVFQRNTFLQLSNGKVGFRNANNEQCLVKNVKVQLND